TEQKINVDEPVSETENLVLQTDVQTQPDKAALTSDEQKQQQQQEDSQHADAVADKVNDSAEVLAIAAGMVMPAVADAQPVQTTSDGKPAQSESAKVTVVKTAAKEMGKAGDGLLTKANTLQQPAAEAQHFQWQALSEQKPGDDQQDPLSMTATEDGSVSRSALDMAKLDKLPVNKDDVPAISKPLTHPDWNKEMGERILWMNNKAIPAAEIKLNPQHLGPITVRIDVSNQDQASVSFSAQHGVVREALEAALPKLREMMSAQNLNLVDVSVAQHSSSNQGQSQAQNFAQTAKQQDHSGSVNPGDEAGVLPEELDTSKARVSKGLLSMYA
ncbi:MAG: flagellar hook-length control protein FliK, partial [Methylococcales bacterium]